ncbi:serine/threonine protein kinase [Gaeumannomyces tritici R3-111a-1]|uniref:Serine/threonine protein kinase n=1 Tax=Gaeumannomyces tritici (strain R3-111a-1) TaxID=644352 RepID=J3NTA0_GAET3|nr:serine/threonine protein kinase [Gaeumannomyces tritici R3-111a-1]EJT79415.1 serine/threonine protein kinase [Gaeumannomyces tritici R3-111a-1]
MSSAPISPRNPTRMGFIPINHGRPSEGDNEIPLTQIRTNASTGARKPAMGSASDEKRSLFRGNEGRGPGRRKIKKDLADQGRRGTSGSDDVALNAMGRIYNKIVGFSSVTRYLVYVVPVALILAVPVVVLVATENLQKIPIGELRTLKAGQTDASNPENLDILQGPPLFELMLWILMSWMALWVGKIVAHLLPGVFMFLCGVVSSGTRKYATVIRALEIPLSLFFWGLSSYLTFTFRIVNQQGWDRIGWVDVMRKILGASFISAGVFLAEKTIVQLISITYHQRSFANRIKDSKRDVYLLGLLYDASRTLFPMYCPEFEEEDNIINDSIDRLLAGGRGQNGAGAGHPMRLIGNVGANVGRIGDKITSVFGNVASEITGKQVFSPNSAHSIVVEALEKRHTSEALAKRIWMSFVVEGYDTLSQDDISEVLGSAHEQEAIEAFEAIDADGNGDISLEEMRLKVVEIGVERKAISNSMKDIGQALGVFDEILLFVVLLIVIFIFLAWFQSDFITRLATAGTAFLSLSFVFAVTTQEFLGSCIFLFVKHPYDVGDRVDITGQSLLVERISLLYTIFTRIDKMEVVQVPNIVLNNLWIENVTRSKAMKETLDVNVSFDTSFEDIELLRKEMEKFVRHPDNSRDFMPDFSISIGSVNDLDKMTLKVIIKHKSNWHNDAVRAARRSKFVCALALALKRVPIYGPGGGGEPLGGALNPAYSVAVDDKYAVAARAKADQDKDAKRMVPTPSEEAAAEELNVRDGGVLGAGAFGGNRDDDPDSPEASERRDHMGQGFQKHVSQRGGRRQAGQTLPTGDDGSAPLLSPTRAPTITRNGASLDVERGNGGLAPGRAASVASNRSNPYYGAAGVIPPTGSGAAAANYAQVQQTSPQSGQAQQQGYSVFPRQQYSPPGSSHGTFSGSSQTGMPLHPLQAAPPGRPRGPSVSSNFRGQQPPPPPGPQR